MNILCLNAAVDLYTFGGAAYCAKEITEGLSRAGHTVYSVAPSLKKLDVLLCPNYVCSVLERELKNTQNVFSTDVVLQFGVAGYPEMPGLPKVITAHGHVPERSTSKLVQFLLTITSNPNKIVKQLKNATVIVPSHYLWLYYKRVHGVDAEVIHHVSNTTVWGEREFILFVGRSSKDKGADIFWRLAKKHRDKKFVALLADGPYRMRELPNLEIHRNKNPYPFYSRAELVVIPSRFEEPFCRVANEARNVGCRILASTRGAIPEVLEGYWRSSNITSPEYIEKIFLETLADKEEGTQRYQSTEMWIKRYERVIKRAAKVKGS